MAKKGLGLSNGDSRVTFSSTASVYFDDVTNAITSSQIAVGELSLPNLGNDRLVSLAAGGFANAAISSTNNGALAWNSSTNSWSGSADIVQEYTGTAGGDLSGTFGSVEGVKVINISNVNSGTLSGLYGGTGASLASGKNVILKASSTGVTYLSASADMSGSYLTSISGKWMLVPQGYPDVRFYTSGSSGNTFTWTKPAGAIFARVIMQGAGGGGGGSGTDSVTLYNGGGGGSGAFTEVIIDVTRTISASIITGIGGEGGTCGNSSAIMTNGSSGTITSFTTNDGIYVFANAGSGGTEANNPNNAAGGAGGAAMSISNGGYSKNGSPGMTGGQGSYTVYGICGGGRSGGYPYWQTVVPIVRSTCFGYNVTSDGIDISTINFVTGTNENAITSTTLRAGYGAGGSSRNWNSTFNGGKSDHGGHGYVIVISW